MAVQYRCMIEDYSRFLKAFKLFLECSTEHQSMRYFIHNTLPDIISSIGGGRSTLNVLGVGSGSGEIDLEILSLLHVKHPEARLENEVVEPSGDMLDKYKDLLSKTPGLNHITFRFNKMTASEFESDWKQRNTDRKLDFIHMIQMLYFITNPGATISFFRSLLDKAGKLLIILVSGQSGFGTLWRTYGTQMCMGETVPYVTSRDIKKLLDAKGIPYQSHTLPSQLDITECFTPGDEKGELLLDFLTLVVEFRKTAAPELMDAVLELLKHPECSREVNGRIIFNNNLEVLVLKAQA